jgi:hypothetical protein
MNLRTRAAALALTALTASTALGACTRPETTSSAPAPAVQRDAEPAKLLNGGLKGQVDSTTALTLIVKNETDEAWTLDGQDFTGVPNTKFNPVLGPHESNRAVVNSDNLDGVEIDVAYLNADKTANLQAFVKVPLFGKDSFESHVWNWVNPNAWPLPPDPRYTVTHTDVSGYTPTVTLTISYA